MKVPGSLDHTNKIHTMIAKEREVHWKRDNLRSMRGGFIYNSLEIERKDLFYKD
jgi:hypothetical protein